MGAESGVSYTRSFLAKQRSFSDPQLNLKGAGQPRLSFEIPVIVYYRVRPSDPSYSEQALEERRAAVQSWLTSHPAAIKAEYIEPETDGFSRPRLRGAIEACKQTGGTLPIARTEQNSELAERVGFEPTVRFPAHTLSKRAP